MKWLSRLLLSVIFLLICLICFNYSDNFKHIFNNKVFNNDIKFSDYRNVFNVFMGKKDKEITTFNEYLNYISKEKIDDYYRLDLGDTQFVNVLKPGIIVFIGDKDNMKNVVIVQGNDGIDLWYGNVTNLNYSLYDYVSCGDILGDTIDNNLYLKILSNGRMLTYEEYIK